MKTIDITISRAADGFYTAFCNDYPALFGGGETAEKAKQELEETLRQTREEGKDVALFYPEWLDQDYVFAVHWDVMSMLEYYSGIITPTALGRLSGIHPKQIWSYMHGITRPRRKQVDKIENALHRLGQELMNTYF